jgi:SAM-dependent methyltransferase
MSKDTQTAAAFASSWNNLPAGSVYTRQQFEEWLQPLTATEVAGRCVLELGCGNASLLFHMASWEPKHLEGIDLGDSVLSARHNMTAQPNPRWTITQADLTTYRGELRDLVYCIGVLHHLKQPRLGFESVLANTRQGGRFHCWVYAREGNSLIVSIVDPIRKVVSNFPWWITKYLIATPLVAPYFVYAKFLRSFRSFDWFRKLPLYAYSLWIAERNFAFFRHVAFDQLVTPQTAYLERATIEGWLQDPRIAPKSTYIIFRNGNSWKFGGKIIDHACPTPRKS